jgi:hypothetical protein
MSWPFAAAMRGPLWIPSFRNSDGDTAWLMTFAIVRTGVDAPKVDNV